MSAREFGANDSNKLFQATDPTTFSLVLFDVFSGIVFGEIESLQFSLPKVYYPVNSHMTDGCGGLADWMAGWLMEWRTIDYRQMVSREAVNVRCGVCEYVANTVMCVHRL